MDVTPRVWEQLLATRNGEGCVCCGLWDAAEQRALDLYGPLARRDVGPMTIGQVGQSLDGRIATPTDDARNISGPDGLMHLHRMRALVDGVMVGVKTALHDRPRLTVRLCDGPQPTRVLLDPRGRVGDDAPLFADDDVRRVVIQTVDRPRPRGVDVIRLHAVGGRLDPADIRSALHSEGMSSLLIEGGGVTLGWFISSALLDRLHVAIAPLLIGGGPPGLSLPVPPKKLSDAVRFSANVFSVGAETVLDAPLTPTGQSLRAPQHLASKR